MSYVDRVAERAASVRLVRVLLSLLAAPFYVLGLVAALVVLAASWAWAACGVGFADLKDRTRGGAG